MVMVLRSLQMQQRYGERVKAIYQQREPGAIMIDFVVVA